MSSINVVVNEAPYLYLIKEEGMQKYHLFILVRVPKGKQINWDNMKVNYMNGSTIVEIDIELNETEDTSSGYFIAKKRIKLTPAAELDSLGGYELTVIANTIDRDNLSTTKRNTTLYKDCDTMSYAEIDALESSDEMYNAPYLYLPNPEAEIGSDERVYAPKCMIILKGSLINQDMIIDSGGNCNYNITINTQTSPNVNSSLLIHPEFLECNKIRYFDEDPIEGEFKVQLILTGNGSMKRSRTGRRQNKSSGSNLNTFIDNLQHV